MWFWEIIKDILYNLFVEIWVVGLIAVTLLAFFGIMIFEAFKEEGHMLIGFFVLLLFALVLIYIVYWYFSRHHYLLGSVAILVCLAVLYMAYIEPHIKN